MDFESLFVDPNGRTSRGQFVPALITLIAAVAFYAFLVKSRTGLFCLLVLLVPATILHARRLHDMGHTAWLLLAPVVLMVASFAIRLHAFSLGAAPEAAVHVLALAAAVGFALWGCIGRGQSEGKAL
jgi:uncharacterized membrane protein YhaH (DUF805 family)